MRDETTQPSEGPMTHAEYRREPYVRAQLADGTIVDGKAAGWTYNHVIIHRQDKRGNVYSYRVDSDKVIRIKRSESSWQDVYDLPGDE